MKRLAGKWEKMPTEVWPMVASALSSPIGSGYGRALGVCRRARKSYPGAEPLDGIPMI